MESRLKRFRMRYDIRSRVITTVVTLLCATTIFYFFYTSSGSYLPAWLTILFLSVSLLILLSSPRWVGVSDENIEIHSLVELSLIPTKDIISIEPIEYSSIRFSLPYFGSLGVFGYYGFFLNLRNFKRFRLYATERKNLVAITYGTKKRHKVILSITERDKFIKGDY